MVEEAIRLSEYIREASRVLREGDFKDLLESEVGREPTKLLETILHIPIDDILLIKAYFYIASAEEKLKNGDKETAELLILGIVSQLRVMRENLQTLEEVLLEWKNENL